MDMKERMLELLTYEPCRTLVPGEGNYIREILSENYQHPKPMFHDLFSGFYHYVQNENFKDTEDVERIKRLDWLRLWKDTYIQDGDHFPLLFKKICFYVIVRWKIVDDKFTDEKFMDILGLHVKYIKKWRIAPQLRSSAEKDTYSVIKSYRSGAKKPYIVSIVKKLYYEAGRKVSNSTTLKKLPRFVDVFAGTAGVAASMGDSKEFPRPIVNDYDPAMVCFAWAFTYCQRELCKRIAEFHNDLMKQDFESTSWSYNESAYEESIDPKNLLTSPKIWDDPKTLSGLIEFMGYTKDRIAEEKMLAQRHKELVIRTRSSYIDVKKVLDFCDREDLRKIDFNNLSPHPIEQLEIDQLEKVLDYAQAMFYYYSFAPSGKNGNVYHETIVDACSYFLYLHRLQIADLDAFKKQDIAVKAWKLTELQLEAAPLTLESTGNFSRHLRGAEFCCKDFKKILPKKKLPRKKLPDDPYDRVYYLDSPYFLTVGYDVGFYDDDHKAMLDRLRDADFKWIFSMQYNPSDRCKCTSSSDEANRKKKHIIKNYGAYYRGFYTPFQLKVSHQLKAKLHLRANHWLKANHRLKINHQLKAIHQRKAIQRVYIPKDTSKQAPSNLYAILFDFDEVKKKWKEMKTETREMLVVNFNCLRTIPLHDTAVVLPFNEFLKCADANMAYKDIVQQAIDWRKTNITNNYASKDYV